MSDAPNSIYVKPNDMYVNGWARPQDTDQFDDEGVEYTRADLADALAAALRSAQQSIADMMGVHGYLLDSGAGEILREVNAALAAWEARK